MKETQIQYKAIVYVHERYEHINIPKMEKAAKGVKLYPQLATNGKIVTATFESEASREEWEDSLLKLSPPPRNFFATELKICGENKECLCAQAKKALDNCRGRFVGDDGKEKNALFLIASFDNQDLRRFWEGTVSALKS